MSSRVLHPRLRGDLPELRFDFGAKSISARGEGRGEGQRQTPTPEQASAPHPNPLPILEKNGERGAVQLFSFGSSQSRKESPNRLKAKTASVMATPGNTIIQGAVW